MLLNLWATWCAPCRQEMPALDKLQAELGGPDFEVVAVNIDTRNLDKPRRWLEDAGVTRLAYYADPQAKVFQDLRAGRQGRGHADHLPGRSAGLRARHPQRPGRMGERGRAEARARGARALLNAAWKSQRCGRGDAVPRRNLHKPVIRPVD